MLRFLLFFILSCIVINPATAAGSYRNVIHGSAYAVIPNYIPNIVADAL